MTRPNTKREMKTLQKIAETQEHILYLRFKWGLGLKRALKRLLETEREIANIEL